VHYKINVLVARMMSSKRPAHETSSAEIWTLHCNDCVAVKGHARKMNKVDLICLIKVRRSLFSENTSHIKTVNVMSRAVVEELRAKQKCCVLGFCINLEVCVLHL